MNCKTKKLPIQQDYAALAKDAHLVYVKDSSAGIARIKKGKGFYYSFKNKIIKDEKILSRIRKLVLPPAWEKVWICPKPNGHLQATGYDTKNRKQYKYHTHWNCRTNETKFHRLQAFGKAIPLLRKKIETDISRTNLDKEKVLATVVRLMEHTAIRIGSSAYEKLYSSYGLTTLKDGHVRIVSGEMKFCFKGKKGISQNITLKNKRLAKIVKACRDIPGKELFQYYNADGSHGTIDSGMVNEYIRKGIGQDFTAKVFRTWSGSVAMLEALKSVEPNLCQTHKKKEILKALDFVSEKLGNTRNVCKSYYVHPIITQLFEEDRLHNYLRQLTTDTPSFSPLTLSATEKILMRIVGKNTIGKSVNPNETARSKSFKQALAA